MLRRYGEVFRALHAVADLIVVTLAWGAAYGLRFHVGGSPDETAHPVYYALVGVAMLPVWYLSLRQRGLYDARRGRARFDEARALLGVASLSTLIVAAGTFFVRPAPISRLVLVFFWAFSCAGLIAFRAALRGALAAVRRRGLNARSVLIVGTGMLARATLERIQNHPEAGLRVVGFLGPAGPSAGLSVIGSLADLRAIVAKETIDQVIIALDRSDPADPLKLVRELGDTTATVRLVLDLGGVPRVQTGLEDLDGLPVLRLIESPLIGWNRVLKRSLDIGVSASLLVLASPILAGLALAVRSSSGGPVFFRQPRMGLDGHLFQIVKFRTMIQNAEQDTGPVWARADDDRCTPVGAVLRRRNLDELPQLWNVLRGEMSLVGPRPERPEFIGEFRAQFPGYMLRHKTKAGMTGWAQVHGYRGNTSVEKRLEYDMEYLRSWSLWLDLKILLLTVTRGFRDPNAY